MGKISKLFKKCLQSLFRCRTLSDILLNTIYTYFLFISEDFSEFSKLPIIPCGCGWYVNEGENSLIFVKIKTFLGNLMHSLQSCYNFIVDFNGNLKNSLSFPFLKMVIRCVTLDFSRTILLKMMQYHVYLQPLKICLEPPQGHKDKVTKPNGVIAVIPTKNEVKENRALNVFPLFWP